MSGIESEVWVVDNASSDDSVSYLQPRFPQVHWIINRENLGFGRANNLAQAQASGAYVLFLNPDTLLPEDCLMKCLEFFKGKSDAGALGIRMVDGSGRFLPESKRAFPGPLTSLYKLIGLSAMFPRSRVFGRYYLGHLSANQSHPVDVLAGAFIMVRRQVLDQTGGFDEQFFMYGEDIDLSYRINNTAMGSATGNWKNYYFAGSSIIHFKGESTKKGTLNYVLLFYKAMVQFVKKHYSSGRASLFIAFIYMAIAARAVVSFLAQLVRRIGLPLMDLVLVSGCLYGTWRVWAGWVRPDVIWMPDIVQFALPAFAGVFLLSGALAGLYSKWYSARRTWSALFLAIMAVLAVYSLLPEVWRFSRGIVLFGGLISGIMMVYFRSILVVKGLLRIDNEPVEFRQTLVAGTSADQHEVHDLLATHHRESRLLGRLGIGMQDKEALMTLDQWKLAPGKLPAREVIFCPGKQLSMASIMGYLLPNTNLRYKFHYGGSGSIVGSDDSDQAGETLAMQVNYKLGQPAEQSKKRLLDILVALALLVTWPLTFIFVKKPLSLLANIFSVLSGQQTWIGYIGTGKHLPVIRPAVLCCNGLPAVLNQELTKETQNTLDARYALDFHYWLDLSLIKNGFRYLGSHPPL